jgi:hypothetical protein
MTQTTPTRFRVYGKDRLFDAWTVAEFDFRWQAEDWRNARAFTRYDSDGFPLLEEFTPTARVRVEWLTSEGWQAYTAWYAPELREHLTRSFESMQRTNSRNTFRLVSEDSPERAQD